MLQTETEATGRVGLQELLQDIIVAQEAINLTEAQHQEVVLIEVVRPLELAERLEIIIQVERQKVEAIEVARQDLARTVVQEIAPEVLIATQEAHREAALQKVVLTEALVVEAQEVVQEAPLLAGHLQDHLQGHLVAEVKGDNKLTNQNKKLEHEEVYNYSYGIGMRNCKCTKHNRCITI